MATTAVRPDTGATIKPGPMITVPAEREVTEDTYAEFAADSGLNGPFLADQFSSFIAHERMGINLMRTLRTRSDNPALRSRYDDMETDAFQAVDVWEGLIRDLGGNPQYASPAGRCSESMDNKLIEALLLTGSADPMTLEQAGLQACLVATQLCLANIRLLEAFAREAKDGESRRRMEEAAGRLRPVVQGHCDWVCEMLEKTSVTQAKHPMARKVGQAAEKMVDKARSVFGRD